MYRMWGTLDLDVSDQLLIYTTRMKRKLSKERTKISCRNYKKINDEEENVCMLCVFSKINIDSAADMFTANLLAICDYHVPMRTITMEIMHKLR